MAASLSAVLKLKYGPLDKTGWGPRLRSRFGYQTPDDWYEATLFQSVTKDTVWLDVGCGRFLLGSNHPTAKVLAKRCRHLVGLDPSDNIDDNPYVHERVKSTLEDYQTDREFDLISLRMVAEHICNPEAAIAALSRLTKPGGQVVIYTTCKWSPACLVAAATPMSVHHAAKRWLWGTEERDSFPVAYKMNTRGTLRRLFAKEGSERVVPLFGRLPIVSAVENLEHHRAVALENLAQSRRRLSGILYSGDLPFKRLEDLIH